MSEHPRTIVLDASILIALFDPEDLWHPGADALLRENLSARFVSSALTLGETLVHPARAGRETAVMAGIRALGVTVAPVDDPVGVARMRAATGLRMPDAVALHTAAELCARLATTDAALVRAANAQGVETITLG